MSTILRMQDICKDYQVGKTPLHVLKNINLEVEEGDYLAIMGPSGSGKTTLMNLIGCLDTATSGAYELGGSDITRCSDNQLAEIRNRKIGFVFQSFNLLAKMSAVDNVALPLLYAGVKKSERIRRAQEALKAVGLEDRMNFRQDQLSGGQCQRVAIARAMVVEPSILLADEPTGALDSESGRQIMALFREIHDQGTTIIMITHDAGIAANADHTVYIRDGMLYTEEGELADIDSSAEISETDVIGQMMILDNEVCQNAGSFDSAEAYTYNDASASDESFSGSMPIDQTDLENSGTVYKDETQIAAPMDEAESHVQEDIAGKEWLTEPKYNNTQYGGEDDE